MADHDRTALPELVLVRGSRAPVAERAGAEVLTWQAFQRRVAERGMRSQLRRYRGVEMRVRFLDQLHRPWATAMVLRAVTRGRCRLIDDRGQARRVTLWHCLGTGLRALLDRLTAPLLLRKTQRQLDRLESLFALRKPPAFNRSRRAIYLRTDLTYGLTAGGSVGHVAGVLNALGAFAGTSHGAEGQPVTWLTTDDLPTVRETIPRRLLHAGTRHWEHVERIALSANRAYAGGVDRAVRESPAGMVYQRYSLNNYTGLRLSAEQGLPLVIEFNGSETWIARHWSGGALRHEKIAQRIESMNLRYADLVVVVSEAMREQAVELGAPAERVLVNPNGVDTERYHPGVDGGVVRDRLGLSGKTVLGFIGTFDRWHGAPVLVEAVARLLADRPGLRESLACVMIGDGPEFALVEERVASLGLSGVVHLTGRVAQPDGPGYLSACDVLVSPHVPNPDGSAFFGSPTKLFEYLAMGRAVVASRLGQIGEVLSDRETALLVEPGDVGALSSALGELIDDAPLRARLAQAGRAQAEREHTWHRHTQRIVDRLASRLDG
ncbi:MAG: glycosyltransferase family 4 protein [Phycisphaerales bacterium JB063]